MSTKAVYLTFAKAAGLRALRSFFQSLLVALPTTAISAGQFDGGSILTAFLASLGVAALSFLTSLATGLPEADTTVQGSTIVSLGKHTAPDA